MKIDDWMKKLITTLLLISAAFYSIHYAIFKDPMFILRYVIAQLGFTPISVILVTMILNKLIGKREKLQRIKKLNMVIGVFFSEAGTDFLKRFLTYDNNSQELIKRFEKVKNWDETKYKEIGNYISENRFEMAVDRSNIQELKETVVGKRQFLLALLENPNLLEHESFTELLWALFHMAEELDARKGFDDMDSDDFDHISNDLKRAYCQLVSQWILYMKHLKEDYPYLYSFALRTNPYARLK